MKGNQQEFEIKGIIGRVEVMLETVLLSMIYYVVWRIGYEYAIGVNNIFPPYLGRGKIVLMGIYAILTLVIFHANEGDQFGHLRLTDIILSQWISVGIVNVVTFFQLALIANAMISPMPFVILTVIDAVVCFSCCYFFTWLYHRFYVPQNILMIYGTRNALDLKFKMDKRSDKYMVTELLPIETDFGTLIDKINEHDAVILNDVPAQNRNDLLKYCYQNRITTYVVPKISDIIVRGAPNVSLFDTPLIMVQGMGLTPTEKFFKRFFDIVLTLIAMIPAAPIMLLVALAIKMDDHGPVFFRQDRVTKDGRVFSILKFRSMIVDAEKDGEVIPAGDNDDRITRVGRFIRATRLDELPQLLNILKGDMSIVGPRPERVEHVEQYCSEIPEFACRLKVKGGLTGYAQIYGKYNTSAYDKLRLDLMYIENYSLLLDAKLIMITLRILFKKESTEGFDKMEELEAMRDEAIAAGELKDPEAEKKA